MVNPHIQAVQNMCGKGGRGCFRFQVYPNFQRRERICGVQKNRYGHNFQNIASKMNLRWVINYDNPLIHFGTDILIIVAVSVFLYTS